MSARDPERLLRQDPSLPADLRRAFAAYSQLEPAADTRAALFSRIERGTLNAATAPVAVPAVRAARKTLWLVVSMLGLSAVGALIWGLSRAEVQQTPATLGAALETEVADGSARSLPGAAPGPESPSDVLSERPIVLPSPQPAHVEPTERKARVRVTSAARAAPTRAAEPVDPAEELALLTRAKRVLPSDASAALNLTREHAARFPRGVFREEREVIAIEALTRGAQRERALSRASAFRQAFPRSTHLDRLAIILREP